MAVDAAPAASEVQDLTVIFQGCGRRPTDGYLFCKLQEGASIDQNKIRIYSPLLTCNRKSCVEFKFLKRDGTEGYAGSIVRDSAYVDVNLSDIVGRPGTILKEQAGEYQIMIRLWWIDPTNQVEKTSRADGLVRIWIADSKAQFLACEDPQVGWQLPISTYCRADISTGYRVAMCGQDCE